MNWSYKLTTSFSCRLYVENCKRRQSFCRNVEQYPSKKLCPGISSTAMMSFPIRLSDICSLIYGPFGVLFVQNSVTPSMTNPRCVSVSIVFALVSSDLEVMRNTLSAPNCRTNSLNMYCESFLVGRNTDFPIFLSGKSSGILASSISKSSDVARLKMSVSSTSRNTLVEFIVLLYPSSICFSLADMRHTHRESVRIFVLLLCCDTASGYISAH